VSRWKFTWFSFSFYLRSVYQTYELSLIIEWVLRHIHAEKNFHPAADALPCTMV